MDVGQENVCMCLKDKEHNSFNIKFETKKGIHAFRSLIPELHTYKNKLIKNLCTAFYQLNYPFTKEALPYCRLDSLELLLHLSEHASHAHKNTLSQKREKTSSNSGI